MKALKKVRRTFSEAKNFDVVVIGGGLAGICAAIAAARLGSAVALVHDRPALGGAARFGVVGCLEARPKHPILRSP